MTDGQIVGVVLLLCVSMLAMGFVIGWCANPSDDHDT